MEKRKEKKRGGGERMGFAFPMLFMIPRFCKRLFFVLLSDGVDGVWLCFLDLVFERGRKALM